MNTKPINATLSRKPRPSLSRAQFLSYKKEIFHALQHGFSKHEIWKLLYDGASLSCSYSQFLRYCQSSGVKPPETSSKNHVSTQDKIETLEERKQFHFFESEENSSSNVREKSKKYLLERFEE